MAVVLVAVAVVAVRVEAMAMAVPARSMTRDSEIHAQSIGSVAPEH